MIENWLDCNNRDENSFTTFRVMDVTEKAMPDENLVDFLGKEILGAYRNLDDLKIMYETEPPEKLDEYIDNYIFPTDTMGEKIVKPGDFGEIVANLIVSYFLKLEVPISKLKWKFNPNKAVFCTDMVAHNQGDKIKNLYYYEIKTRQTVTKKEGHHFSIHAHNGLSNDMASGHDGIADFLMRYYSELKDFDKAKKYHNIILNPKQYNKLYELFFIVDKTAYKEEVLSDLEAMPPTLKPLNITLVLLDNFRALVDKCYDRSRKQAHKHIYG